MVYLPALSLVNRDPDDVPMWMNNQRREVTRTTNKMTSYHTLTINNMHRVVFYGKFSYYLLRY